MKKRIIWSNIDLNPEDWKEDYEECAICNGWDEDTSDPDNLYKYMMDTNMMYLDDERTILNRQLNGRILIIADLGLWNGRKQGYKIIEGNIANILYDSNVDFIEWYADGYNIRATAHHHDGTDYYLYREIREDRNIQILLDDIYNGRKITKAKLNYYTRSIRPYVAKIHGWKKGD